MDTRTGEIIALDPEKAAKAEELWQLWLNGRLSEMPQYAPIDGDKKPVRPKSERHKKRKRTKATKSWRTFANG